MQFTWSVECWEEQTLCVSLHFSNASRVSASPVGIDELSAKVLDPGYFLSASSLKAVDSSEGIHPVPILSQMQN